MLNAVLILVFGLLVSACSQPQKKPFSNPRRYADPPPTAVPAPGPGGSGPAAGWSQSVAERVISGYPRLRESVWMCARPPHGQHDHIAVHRIRAADPPADRPLFFFLPGAHHHGEVVVADERYDLRLYLAQRGIESWTLNYRTHFISREQIFDSDFMQGWTTQVFIEDAAAAADFVRHTSGVQKIFVGGYSRGASFAALMAARYSRQDVLGLALLDGYVLEPPEWRTIYRERKQTPAWFADDLERRYVPYRRWIKVLQETLAEPDGPDFMPVHLFENRAEMLKHFLFVSPTYGQQGGLSNARGGYADILVLARIFLHQDRYWARVQNHGGFELQRHLADAGFDYASALAELNVPIIAFASGNMDKAGIAWAGRVEYTARATASRDVQYSLLQDWGHLDVLLGMAAAERVFSPLAEWIRRHTPHTP